MGRNNRDLPHSLPHSSAFPASAHYHSDNSDLESPASVFGPSDAVGGSSRLGLRYQGDANNLYAVAAHYQDPTSIYAPRQTDHLLRIPDARLSSPTSATSGSEHELSEGGGYPIFAPRNHVYFAMQPPDPAGPRLPMAMPITRIDTSGPFAGDYNAYNDPIYRMGLPVDGSGTYDSSSPVLDESSRRGTSKQLSTVVIACRPCRGRKIRCDSRRPACGNCLRRRNECIYDSAPKRRGPDKRPGTRQRSCKKRPADGSEPPPPSKRRRNNAPPAPDSDVEVETPRTAPTASAPVESAVSNMQQAQKADSPSHKRAADPSDVSRMSAGGHPSTALPAPPLRITTDLYKASHPSPRSSGTTRSSASSMNPLYASPYGVVDVRSEPHSPFAAAAPKPVELTRTVVSPLSPQMESNQRAWWALFLKEYPLDELVADLTYVFADTGHWLNFINLPFFLDMLWSPPERLNIQPAFVLSGLALAELMRSSNAERGASGRVRAAWLKDRAQAALQSSMSGKDGTPWIDVYLAEAALIIVLFESSAHPAYHPDRVSAALRVLDEILGVLSLSMLDASDASVPRFAAGAVPTVVLQLSAHCRPGEKRRCACNLRPGSPTPDRNISCSAPLTWDPAWSAADIRTEECRRVVWSALSVASNYIVQCVAFDREVPVLEMCNPTKYALLFPGETMDRLTPAYTARGAPSPKESVWALYCRSLLLWNFCNRLLSQSSSRNRTPRQLDEDGDAFQEAWNEAQAIEDALEIHICNYETGVAYLCQEYIFNTRMTVTQAMRRMHSLAREISTTPGPLFNRKQALEWIHYQASVIKCVKIATYQLGGPGTTSIHPLSRRPFQVSWFLNQFSICMQIWTHDTGLAEAVDLGKDSLVVVEMLNALWPCKFNQTETDTLRKQLTQACVVVGVDPPPPPTPAYAMSLIRL